VPGQRRIAHHRRSIAALGAIGALALSAGACSEPDNEGRVRSDCFTDSPESRPTPAEERAFTRIDLPPEARGLTATCVGFMDRNLVARFDLPRSALGPWLRASGFRVTERVPLRAEDGTGPFRRLSVTPLDAGWVRVEVRAFET
jgi:hypothetical protein